MQNNSFWIVLQKLRAPFIVIVVTYTISIIGLILIDGVDANGNAYKMTIFDAFYFVTYTATTIGFGETPYAFTYPQRLWVTFSIYLTVIGWFYSIGTLIGLFQNKLFLSEISRVTFRRQVQRIKKKFIVIIGFNYVTNEIIKKLLANDIQVVVIEKNKERANALILESYTPTIPILTLDAYKAIVLEEAGIKRKNCKAVISLFEDDALNLRIAVVSKLLNKNIQLVVKSTTQNSTNNLLDVNANIVANPFLIIANELYMAINSPNLLKLQKWLYGIESLNTSSLKLPNRRYIICGFGRLGQAVYEKLKNTNTQMTYIELDKNKFNNYSEDKACDFIVGDADDKNVLKKAGVKEACGIVAFTNNDTVNISILATARKLNKNIITIAREDEVEDFSIFSNAKIDYLFMPSKILINKIANALIRPLSDIFAREIKGKDDYFASKLLKNLIKKIDFEPKLFELRINKDEANQIVRHLNKNKELPLSIFEISLHNRNFKNNIIVLLLKRGEKILLLPSEDTKLELDDEILFACDDNARDDIEYISQNYYEFEYALSGKEKKYLKKQSLNFKND